MACILLTPSKAFRFSSANGSLSLPLLMIPFFADAKKKFQKPIDKSPSLCYNKDTPRGKELIT